MRHITVIAFILFGLAGRLELAGADTNVATVPKVAITNLLAHKEEYKGKKSSPTAMDRSWALWTSSPRPVNVIVGAW